MPAALIAGTVVGAIVKGKSEKQAANAQVDASNAAIAEQRRQYDQTRQDQMPWMAAGTQAVNALANPQGSFQASPGYQFRLSEGQRDIGNSFAARGGAFSGNALKALTNYNQNMASNEYGNWWNQQSGLAGLGQTAVQGVSQAGQQTAANVGNALMQAGNARASGIRGAGDALSGLATDMGAMGYGWNGLKANYINPSSSYPGQYGNWGWTPMRPPYIGPWRY